MGHMEKRVVPAVAAMAAAAVLIFAPANANAQEAAPAAQTEQKGSAVGNFFRNALKQADSALQQGANGAQAAVDGVNAAHAAVNSNTVRGRMTQRNGSTVTCFNGIEACYIGPRDMTSPGQATGTPLLITTRDGRALPNNADRLAAEGVIVAPPAGGARPGATGRSETGYNDRDNTGCITPGMTRTEIANRSNEIIACQAMVLSERDAAAIEARQAQRRANAGAAAPAAAAPQDPRIAQIQNNAAAGFAAILQQANAAGAKPK